jgi:hypothetical protein
MRKMPTVIIASVVLLLLGIVAWNAEAMTPNGVATIRHATGYSLVEKAGLFSRSCPRGMHQVCTAKGCACGPATARVQTLTCSDPYKTCYRACWSDENNEGVTLCKYCAKSC